MSEEWLTWVLLSVLALATVVPFWVYSRSAERDIFAPVYAATAYFILLFVIRPIYDLTLSGPYLGPPPWPETTRAAFNTALAYLTPAFLTFLIGYYAPWGRSFSGHLPRLPRMWSSRRLLWVGPLLFAAGAVSYLLLIEYLGGLSHYLSNKQEALTAGGQGYLGLGVSLIPILLMVLVTRALTTGRGKVLTFVVLFPLTLIIGFFSGSKGVFLTPILTLLVAVHYLKSRIKVKHVLSFVVFVVLVFPIFNVYREVHDVSLVRLQPSVYSDVGTLANDFMARFIGIDAVAYAIRDTPSVMDYQYGNTVLPITYVLVPRQLWPDKPTVSFSKIFGETYFVQFFHLTGTAASPTILGEAYINFHVPGMLLIALWCGFVLRAIYEYCIRLNRGAPAVFVYGIVFLYLFIFWEFDIIGLIAYSSGALALALGMAKLVGADRSDSPRRDSSTARLAPETLFGRA